MKNNENKISKPATYIASSYVIADFITEVWPQFESNEAAILAFANVVLIMGKVLFDRFVPKK